MSLEALLEAARYLEYQDEAQTRGEIPKDYTAFSSSSAGPPEHQPPVPGPAPRPAASANGLLAAAPSPPDVPGDEDPPPLPPCVPPPPRVPEEGDGASVLPPSPPSPSRAFRRAAVLSGQPTRLEDTQELRRRVGSGTREVHNKLEKNRRAHLKECFELLKKQLPVSQEEKKSSNLSILHSALRYIQSLKRKERDYEHEMERLAREKIASQQRLSALKKELSAQWDHIDFNSLLPQDPLCPIVAGPGDPCRTSPPVPRALGEEEEAGVREGGPLGGPLQPGSEQPAGPGLLLLPPSDHHSVSTSTASEQGHLSDDGEDAFSPMSSSRAEEVETQLRALQQKRLPVSLLPTHHCLNPSSISLSPTPLHQQQHHHQRGSVLHQSHLLSKSPTVPYHRPHSPLTECPLMEGKEEEEAALVTSHTGISRALPGVATALVSPSTSIRVLATPTPNHHHQHQGLHPGTAAASVPSMSHSLSPQASYPPTSSPPVVRSSSPPMHLAPQQPLALTVHAAATASTRQWHHNTSSSREFHQGLEQDHRVTGVPSASMAAAISVPTIHLTSGKVIQQPVTFLQGPVATAAPPPASVRSPEVQKEMEVAIRSSPLTKFTSQQHHLQKQPSVAITAGSITLPNGVVAHASSANAGIVALTQAASTGNSSASQSHSSIHPALTLAHTPASGITHLMAPLAGGHAALVTASGATGAGHPLMTPLALVSSTGGPVAAHILGAATAAAAAGNSGSLGGTAIGTKALPSTAPGAIPLLKPVAMGNQLPLVNAQYLTTAAALGGLAHLVKPLVVVSSAHSTPTHGGSNSKLPSSLVTHTDPSPPQ